MLKKITVFVMFVCSGLLLSACGETINSYVAENMSEITYDYYFGESSQMFASLSVGERESEYLYNGESTQNVNFSLLTVGFEEDINKVAIIVSVKVGEETFMAELEYSSLDNVYMADIEKEINGQVEISYNDDKVILDKISDNFAINSNKAIDIACQNLSEQLSSCKSFNNFNAECYLRILDNKVNNFDQLYWCFTCIDKDGKSFSIIISIDDGKVLAKN